MPEKTPAQKKAQKNYMVKFARLEIRATKEERDVIQAHAAAQGESANAFIGRAISEAMERDSSGSPQEAAGAAAGTGGISLSPDALDAAQQAAERTGEAPAVFVARAIETQAKRDKSSIALGINPATGDKLDSKGGADHE